MPQHFWLRTALASAAVTVPLTAHLMMGLAASAVILSMCVTGAALALKPQITLRA